MPPISVLMKPASGLCNMHCDYCFYADEQANRTHENFGFMSERTLKNIIRRTLLHAEGAASFAFQGGEPTLRGLDFFRKVVLYEEQYNKNYLRIQNALQTNGLLLDREWCVFLRDNHFLVGVSLDGVQAVHDRFRHLNKDCAETAESAFLCAMEKIRLLRDCNVEFNILTVVTDDLADHIEEVYHFYQQEDFRWQQYIACLDPLEGDAPRSYSLTPKKYQEFLIRLWDLWQKDPKRPFIRQFDNWVGMIAGYPPEACDMRGICGIQYVCEADGSVYPCDFYMTDQYCLGNFNSDRIDAVDEKRNAIAFIENSMKLPGKCLSCKWLKLCRGGCRRNRDEMQLNRFCGSYSGLFEARVEDMKHEAARIRE
ncbi:MAG: anaerobic sulfatase maturase [Lachnospiraceae bacterium]|nr:anaerobic sulfatase maturase [Lachnospiraceae bacterium]